MAMAIGVVVGAVVESPLTRGLRSPRRWTVVNARLAWHLSSAFGWSRSPGFVGCVDHEGRQAVVPCPTGTQWAYRWRHGSLGGARQAAHCCRRDVPPSSPAVLSIPIPPIRWAQDRRPPGQLHQWPASYAGDLLAADDPRQFVEGGAGLTKRRPERRRGCGRWRHVERARRCNRRGVDRRRRGSTMPPMGEDRRIPSDGVRKPNDR